MTVNEVEEAKEPPVSSQKKSSDKQNSSPKKIK